jgi:hypothetical protein
MQARADTRFGVSAHVDLSCRLPGRCRLLLFSTLPADDATVKVEILSNLPLRSRETAFHFGFSLSLLATPSGQNETGEPPRKQKRNHNGIGAEPVNRR